MIDFALRFEELVPYTKPPKATRKPLVAFSATKRIIRPNYLTKYLPGSKKPHN